MGETAMASSKNGQTVQPNNIVMASPQSTQEDLATLRESLTSDVQTINRCIESLSMRLDNKLTENGAQDKEERTTKKGEVLTRPLFILSFNSVSGSGRRTELIGNSSRIRSAIDVFLEDPTLADAVRADRIKTATTKLNHAKKMVEKLTAELAALNAAATATE
jgi:hypothetical protein